MLSVVVEPPNQMGVRERRQPTCACGGRTPKFINTRFIF